LREEPEGDEGDGVEGGCSEERCAAEDAGEQWGYCRRGVARFGASTAGSVAECGEKTF
jgi:hypothetical protein